MKERSASEKRKLTRIHRLWERQEADEIKVNPGYQTHEDLLEVMKKLPTDFEPYGQRVRDVIADCSCGCRWFHILAGRAGHDWGICANPASPRAGLLTFEHQGCPQFEDDPRYEYLDSAKGREARQRFEQGEGELKSWHKS